MNQEKDSEKVDGTEKRVYITLSPQMIRTIQDESLKLARLYGNSIKIEVNVNPQMGSVKMAVTQYVSGEQK